MVPAISSKANCYVLTPQENLQSRIETIAYCKIFKSLQPSVAFDIETIHLFLGAKKMTDFYMKCNTGLKWVKVNS